VSAFAELQDAYANRFAGARAAASTGQKVVGLVGATVPVELVLAAGGFPVNLAPLQGAPTPLADRSLEAHFDGEVRAVLQALLEGSADAVDLVVISRSSDGYLELYYALKELVRLGDSRSVPPLHLYDLLHGRSEANRRYSLERTRELAARLEAATGGTVDAGSLAAAVGEVNAQRAAVRSLLEARRDPGRAITGTDAMTAIGAGRFLRPGRHAELVRAYLEESRAALQPRPRLLVVSGTALSDLRLHAALEAGGAVVVAEDDAWGSRFAGRDVPGDAPDLLEAVLDKVFFDVPSPRQAPAAVRDEWLRAELGRGGFDAAVFHVPPEDHWFGWDYPRLRALVEAAGLPSLLLRDLDVAIVERFLREGAGV
jgi:benzoyl-CoA reductase/2-hydroxyglutaryl-CoA dehydratase subunit BcrC/BadD/HgdB